MMTLGKAKKYYYERLKQNGSLKDDPKYNMDPPFENIFEFYDKDEK
jgi:hypothetical protein